MAVSPSRVTVAYSLTQRQGQDLFFKNPKLSFKKRGKLIFCLFTGNGTLPFGFRMMRPARITIAVSLTFFLFAGTILIRHFVHLFQ